ncbi:Structural maintenance of chromosomes protein 6 [Gonapodya sp. JEL0774]|nr:Structural maintenance of chromosomes protein 6 [Gonapodya sp. JEL0774]
MTGFVSLRFVRFVSQAFSRDFAFKNGKRFPRNVSSMLCKEGYSVGSASGGNITRSINLPNQLRLSADTAAQIQLQRDLKAEQEHKYGAIQTELRNIERERGSASRLRDAENASFRIHYYMSDPDPANCGALQVKCRSLDSRIRSLQVQLRELLEELSERVETANVANLEEEKRAGEERIAELQRQYPDVVAQMAIVKNEKLPPLKDQIEKIKADINDRKSEAAAKQGELDDLHRDVTKFAARTKQWEEKKEHYEGMIKDLKKNRDERAALVQEATERASTQCERVNIEFDAKQLEKKIRESESRLREREKNVGSRADVEAKLKAKKEMYEDAKRKVVEMRQLSDELADAHSKRATKLDHLTGFITARSRMVFADLLNKRGYSGSLRLDHKAQKLTMKVRTDSSTHLDNTTNGGKRDPATLSGGEKSFSQVCLLLAMWEAMGSPVRCLDEFDVFMDAVNRNMALKMMSEFARSSEAQYIFITPQDQPKVDIDGVVCRVHKLKDPVRGDQRRLDDMIGGGAAAGEDDGE